MLRWIYRRFWPALKNGVTHWSSDNGSLHSAALAYYAAFSLFPLCLTLVAVLGFLAGVSGQAQDCQEQMLRLVRQHVDVQLTDQLQVILLGVKERAIFNGPLGLLTLAVACLAIFVQLEAMFDNVWHPLVARRHSWLTALWSIVYQRLIAFLMLMGIGALLILLFIANLTFSGAARLLVVQLPVGHTAWLVTQATSVIAGNTLLLTMVFKAIPPAPVRWRDALCGSLLVALIWQIGQHFLTVYVISDRYSVYGVVGSFIALMLWFYYASAVMFLGAEVVHALDPKSDNGRPTA